MKFRREQRDRIARAALLDDDTRFGLYTFLRDAGRPVTREQAAAALRISPALAAFHLEKLLNAGLLSSHLARPEGRSGPGAGRTAKFYRPEGDGVAVTVPARRYDLAGMILTEAVRQSLPAGRSALRRAARRRGTAEGKASSRGATSLDRAQAALADAGFEPSRREPGTITLANCPFRTLALDDPDIVCDMNLAFVKGVLRGARCTARAHLTREPDVCCVTVRA